MCMRRPTSVVFQCRSPTDSIFLKVRAHHTIQSTPTFTTVSMIRSTNPSVHYLTGALGAKPSFHAGVQLMSAA